MKPHGLLDKDIPFQGVVDLAGCHVITGFEKTPHPGTQPTGWDGEVTPVGYACLNFGVEQRLDGTPAVGAGEGTVVGEKPWEVIHHLE